MSVLGSVSKRDVDLEAKACIGFARHATVDALLDAFHRAAETSNLSAYFGCFHAQGRFLGTDASENWTAEEFFAFSKLHFLSTPCAWKYTPIAGSRKATYFPINTPQGAQFCTFDELLESESFLATSRGSGTLVFDAEHKVWLIAAYHLTFPVPNELAVDMTKKIAVFEAAKKNEDAAAAAERLIAEWDLEETGSDAKASKTSSKKKSKKK